MVGPHCRTRSAASCSYPTVPPARRTGGRSAHRVSRQVAVVEELEVVSDTHPARALAGGREAPGRVADQVERTFDQLELRIRVQAPHLFPRERVGDPDLELHLVRTQMTATPCIWRAVFYEDYAPVICLVYARTVVLIPFAGLHDALPVLHESFVQGGLRRGVVLEPVTRNAHGKHTRVPLEQGLPACGVPLREQGHDPPGFEHHLLAIGRDVRSREAPQVQAGRLFHSVARVVLDRGRDKCRPNPGVRSTTPDGAVRSASPESERVLPLFLDG